MHPRTQPTNARAVNFEKRNRGGTGSLAPPHPPPQRPRRLGGRRSHAHLPCQAHGIVDEAVVEATALRRVPRALRRHVREDGRTHPPREHVLRRLAKLGLDRALLGGQLYRRRPVPRGSSLGSGQARLPDAVRSVVGDAEPKPLVVPMAHLPRCHTRARACACAYARDHAKRGDVRQASLTAMTSPAGVLRVSSARAGHSLLRVTHLFASPYSIQRALGSSNGSAVFTK